MAENDYVDELFLDLLEKYFADSLETAGRNQNCRSDDAVHEHPEAPDHEIRPNSSLESDRNFSDSSFSRETRIASCPATQSSLQSFGSSFDISTWASLAGAQQSNSEATEANPAYSFLAPLEGDFCRTEDNQSKTAEECREFGSASAIFPPIDAMSSIEMATDRASLGSGAGAEAVPIAWPSGFQTLSNRTGKEKLFKCDVCDKTFGKKWRLDEHNRTHTGKTPFECNTCGRRFAQKGSLTRHLRSHTGEKLFPCDICGKRFARKDHLEYHLRTHTGEKPFKCKFCDECFSHQSSCTRHQKRKHCVM